MPLAAAWHRGRARRQHTGGTSGSRRGRHQPRMRDLRSDRFTCASVVNKNAFFRFVEVSRRDARCRHTLELEITLDTHPPDGGVLIPTGCVTVGALDPPSLIAFTECRKFSRYTVDPCHNWGDLWRTPRCLRGGLANGAVARERWRGCWAAVKTQAQHQGGGNTSERPATSDAHIRTVLHAGTDGATGRITRARPGQTVPWPRLARPTRRAGSFDQYLGSPSREKRL
jgi:hypothetical protein